jgi:hypothetical protein
VKVEVRSTCARPPNEETGANRRGRNFGNARIPTFNIHGNDQWPEPGEMGRASHPHHTKRYGLTILGRIIDMPETAQMFVVMMDRQIFDAVHIATLTIWCAGGCAARRTVVSRGVLL